MRRPMPRATLLLLAVLAVGGCRVADGVGRTCPGVAPPGVAPPGVAPPGVAPPGCAPLGYAPLLAAIEREDPEARYHAVLRLGRHDSVVVRARLRSLLASEEALTRNAAARALLDLGEEDAAAALTENLHRDQRTFVTMDAIHHLREYFGEDLGYDANRGYRHQTQALEAWWTWWETHGHERPVLAPDPDEYAATRTALAERVGAYEAEGENDDESAWKAAKALWASLAEIAPSRNPADVAVVARGFGVLARRFPDQVDLWNNHALCSLNDGRTDDALAAYRHALALTPNDAQLQNDLGILHEATGRWAEARDAYRKATTLAPEDDIAWSNLGDVLVRLGCTAEAVAAYREAERLAPEKWHYHRLWIARSRVGPTPCRPAVSRTRPTRRARPPEALPSTAPAGSPPR